MPNSSHSARLLHLDSSALGDHSVSRRLSARLVEQWRSADPAVVVTYRDLAAEPIAHLSGEILQAHRLDPEQLNPAQRRERTLSDALIDEFLAADAVVLGAPMYNFAISSQLKAWIDRILQPGRTFRYTPGGPIGLASGKRVVIVSTRGGVYTTPERRALDFQESYLRLVFGFVGITDISIVRAEGLALGPEPRERALNAAASDLAGLFRAAA
jgi:FMN-dependent NADH-azoreductase